MLTLMFWQRSCRTSRMSEPGRRLMEEQEPSGSTTLHWRPDRSHAATEWRFSPWTGAQFMLTWCYGNFSTLTYKKKKMSGLEMVMARSVLPWRPIRWNLTSVLQEVAISRLVPDDREPWDSLRPLLPQ